MTVRCVGILLGIWTSLGNWAVAGDKFSDYQYHVRRYMAVMGVTNPIYFTTAVNGVQCGWVRLRVTPPGFEAVDGAGKVEVGMSTHPVCESYPAKTLARHEVCHLRMKHLWLTIPTEEKEKEVHQCMKWYRNR